MANAIKANVFLRQAKDHQRAQDYAGEVAYLGLAENHLRLALSDCDIDSIDAVQEMLETTTNRKLTLMAQCENVSPKVDDLSQVDDNPSKFSTEKQQSGESGSGSSADSSEDSGSDSDSDSSRSKRHKRKGKKANGKRGKKKSKKCPFSVTKPKDVDPVVGQNEAKLILLSNICGPMEHPKHFEKMKRNAKLKAFCLYGPPGNFQLNTYLNILFVLKYFITFHTFKL